MEVYGGVKAYLASMGRVAASLKQRPGEAAPRNAMFMLWQKTAEVAGVKALGSDAGVLRRQDRFKVVRWVVEASLQDLNPVRQVAIHVIHRKSTWPLRVYRIRSHPMYTLALIALVLGLMSLSFSEAQLDAANNADLVRTVLALEIVMLALLGMDLAVYWVLHFGRTLRRVHTSHSSMRAVEFTVVGKPRQRVLVGGFRSAVVVMMMLDWCVRVSTGYSTGAPGAELFVPWTVMLRPLLLFSLSPVLRHALVNLGKTIYESKLVFGLGASFIVVAAVTSGMLLGKHDLDSSEGLGRGFSDFRSTFLTMFIFLATGEVGATGGVARCGGCGGCGVEVEVEVEESRC